MGDMDIQKVIDRDITSEIYRRALIVYLKHAYPMNKEVQQEKIRWLDNPHFFKDGIPKQSRFGCHVNGHMKLRCGYLNEDYGAQAGFWVDTNDLQDSDDIRTQSRAIALSIEAEWLTMGIHIIEVINNEMDI